MQCSSEFDTFLRCQRGKLPFISWVSVGILVKGAQPTFGVSFASLVSISLSWVVRAVICWCLFVSIFQPPEDLRLRQKETTQSSTTQQYYSCNSWATWLQHTQIPGKLHREAACLWVAWRGPKQTDHQCTLQDSFGQSEACISERYWSKGQNCYHIAQEFPFWVCILRYMSTL